MPDVDYRKIDDLDPAGQRFFKVFLRLEFALKECRYRQNSRDGVKIEWDRFCRERLGQAFFDEMNANVAAQTLIQRPPKKQSVDANDNLEWGHPAPVTNVQELGGALCRLRNNLFHGGKHGDPDQGRNESLFSAALFIIDQMLLKDDQLRAEFEGIY